MSAAAWRAALRMARRDAWRAKGRSLLVIALIGLPIFALGVADIVYRTWQLSPSEKLTRTIGAADAGIRWVGGEVEQPSDGALGEGWGSSGDPRSQHPKLPATAQLLSRLPAGSRAIEHRTVSGSVDVRTDVGIEYATMVGLRYTDPIARGLVNQVDGRAPGSAHEAAITTALADAAGLRVGDTLRLTNPDRTFTVVGTVRNSDNRGTESVYVLPEVVTLPSPRSRAFPLYALSWLVRSPQPITWAQVLKLNEDGYLVTSRHVVLHPPPKSEVPYETSANRPISPRSIAIGVLIGGMALLEVVLLAGPAFAVSARRQRRNLALIASVGGRSRDLRNVVLAGAIVLGVASGLVGIAIALVGTAIGIPTLGPLVDDIPGHFDVRPGELAALVGVAVFTALAAAAFPARSAARTDVVNALAGRRGTVRTRKRVVALGLATGALGVAVALGAATSSTRAEVILAGVALVELGLIICTPGLLGLAARLGRRLPLAPRIALRDAGRNRSAAAPAVAAVMASVIGAIALVLVVASSDDQNRRGYQQSLPMHDAYVGIYDGSAAQADELVAALRTSVPDATITTVRGLARCRAAQRDDGCTFTTASLPPQQIGRYHGSAFGNVIVDDGSGLSALFAANLPRAAAALRAGTVVTVEPSAVRGGRVQVDLATQTIPAVDDTRYPGQSDAPATRRVTVPALAVTAGFPAARLVIPPSVAGRLGLDTQVTGVLVTPSHELNHHDLQVMRGRIADVDPELYLIVEDGYHNPDGWLLYGFIGVAALIAVGAAVIATALANVDGRADLVTLGAVGASPRTRRVLSSSRAGVIAGIGAVLGTAAGFVPAYAWVRSEQALNAFYSSPGWRYPRLELVIPWTPLLAALIGIPLLAVLVAGALGRSRLPSERPADT